MTRVDHDMLEASLELAVLRTLETLCMMDPEDEVRPDGAADFPCVGGVRVGFSGPWEGHLDVCAFGDVLAEATEVILGGEHEPTLDMMRDALGELGNIVCGSALLETFGVDQEFRIHPPEWIEGGCFPPPPSFLAEAVDVFPYENGRFVFKLRVFEPAPAGRGGAA